MKSLEELWRVAAIELAAWCCTSAARDAKTVTSRIKDEGLSFLTITLPDFAKDFEKGLEAGQVDSSFFTGFHRQRKSPLPVFLGGFLSQVFDSKHGLLLDEPNVDCIFAIRQLTLMFKKIRLPSTPARDRGAIRGYIETEKEVKEAALVGSSELYLQFARVAALLYSDVWSELENQLSEDGVVPRHGPGATADRLRGNAKFDQSEWPLRMEKAFSHWEYTRPVSFWAMEIAQEKSGEVHLLEPGDEKPVRVTLVPKTLKTPRIIAIEPTCMQYMQQGVAKVMCELLESHRIKGNTRENVMFGQIGFVDQVPNRLMAYEGSLSGSLATLDLSEASDRVSMRHVESLVPFWPLLKEALEVTRSSKASVPGKGVISLSKFASMGSALTFPIEAAVFLTAVYMGIENELGRHILRRDVLSLRGKVRVYGDDIIVPVEYVRSVISVLDSLGFKINTGKSFWNGKFRESCGGDFYDGHDVLPVKVTDKLPTSRSDVHQVLSTVALRNSFYQKGMWSTAAHLDSVIWKVLPHFPIVESTSPIIGRDSVSFPYQGERHCDVLHRPLVKGFVAKAVIPNSPVSGYGALLKFFLKQGDEPSADVKHLERQGRPESVRIKIRWLRPY